MEALSETFKQWQTLWRLLGTILLVIIGLAAALYLKEMWILISAVITITYALDVPLEAMERLLTKLLAPWQLNRRLPIRFIAILLMLALSIFLVVQMGWGWWQMLKVQSQALWKDLPFLHHHYGFNESLQPITRWVKFVEEMARWLLHSMSNGLHGIASGILILYLLLDGHQLRQTIIDSFGRWPRTQYLLASTHRILQSYMREQLLVSVFSGTVMTGIFFLLGFKYSVLLGFFSGLCSILPVAGPWIGLIPAILLSLISPHPESVGWLLLWTGAVYLLKEYLLLPYILGNALEIHPVMIIVVFLACMELFGLMGGLFMAFPLASLLAAAVYLLKPTTTVR